jgi:predicted nucleotidyltransferase
MITVTNEVLDRMVEAIVREVDPEEIWLFGSRARGEAAPDSDVDLLIVEREPFGPKRSRWKELTRLYDLAARFRVPTDFLVYAADEVEDWHQAINHVVAWALREGKLLYARS